MDLLSAGRRTFRAHKHGILETSETAEGKHYIYSETFCVYSFSNNFVVCDFHTLNIYFMRCNVAVHKQ
jgi:hypothetical protein